ncbi:MAG: molecular chaperone DnaJ [Verrucomicrobia bacterium]|nr:molecular chaperone DnaJ [Verrucomicrobiota bacterium]
MNDPLARHRKLVEQFPDNELARFSLGKALFDQNQFTEAKGHFELAASRKPEWMMAHILLGKCELALSNRSAARVAFEHARRLAIEQNHEGPLTEMNQALAELAQTPAE